MQNYNIWNRRLSIEIRFQCIPVGYARSLTVSCSICRGGVHAIHAPLPCMPLPGPPCHAHSLPHTPSATCAPCHACPPATHAPLLCPLPHMPPCRAHPTVVHAPTMHAPLQCTPSCHTRLPLPRMPPCRQTNTCENITFANFVCGR